MATRTVTLHEAVEAVEALPEEQQETLVEIVRNRYHERRRDALVENVRQARAERARGEVRSGTVDELFAETTPHSR